MPVWADAMESQTHLVLAKPQIVKTSSNLFTNVTVQTDKVMSNLKEKIRNKTESSLKKGVF